MREIFLWQPFKPQCWRKINSECPPFFVLAFHNWRKESRLYALPSSWVFSYFRLPKMQLLFICVDGIFICLFFRIRISMIFIYLSNKIVLTKLRSKEINLHNKRFQHNTRFVVTNFSNGISMVVYKSVKGPIKLKPDLVEPRNLT